MSILAGIASPADLRKLSVEQLDKLTFEVRERIIDVTSRNGGHIGPNLGVVELTLALHLVFDSPTDRLVFDVSHQGYVHKLFTGRNTEAFDRIRTSGGLSGFLSRTESEHDPFGAGHAGTALSAALGMAVARDKKGEDRHVVAILGDAAFTCGITMEALNNVASATKRLIIVLNDNEWSIAKNVGALANYFNTIITNPVYNRLDRDLRTMLEKMPGGETMLEFGRRWKKETKDFFVGSSLFETYGLRYIGPVDGHDRAQVVKHLEFAKKSEQPIIVHLHTEKGRGYLPAISAPEKFHGLGPFDRVSGNAPPPKPGAPLKYQDIFGQTLVEFAKEDKRIVGITAAMPPGTGLNHLKDALPEQFVDVGIAEEHAVLFAAGLATEGMKPVVAVYSTFLQRSVDNLIHDVCLQNLPVTFCLDRAGLSANDGPTHHGLFDIGYTRIAPNAVVMQPKDEAELRNMLWTSIHSDQPCFIRYPKGNAKGVAMPLKAEKLEVGKAEVLRTGRQVQMWALGPWVSEAMALADRLSAEFDVSCGVVNARFVKPLDVELMQDQAEECRLFVTFEDHVLTGGFGSVMLESLADAGLQKAVLRIGYPDQFVDHGSNDAILRKSVGLDTESIYGRILGALELKAEDARRVVDTGYRLAGASGSA